MFKPVSRALRARLLLGASFGILQLGAGAVIAMAPSVANAANECGDPSSNGATADVLGCPAGTYPGGITEITDGNLTLVLLESAAGAVVVQGSGMVVSGTPSNSITIARGASLGSGFDPSFTGTTTAIRASGNNANVIIDVSDVDSGDTPMSVTATNGVGLLATTTGAGSATIVTSNGTVQATSASLVTGQQATTSGSGNATINGGASVTATAATGGYGIGAFATGTGAANLNYTGAVSLTSTSGSSIAAQANGVAGVTSVVSDVKVSTTGGTFSIGANGLSASGNVSVTATKAEASGLNTPFVAAVNGDSNFGAGTGTVTLDVGTAKATGTGSSAATGINATTRGIANVTAGTVTVSSAAAAYGIGVGVSKNVASTVIKSTSITATGASGLGIGVSAAGEVKITSGAVTTTGLNAAIGVETLTGDVTIDSTTIQATGAGALGVSVNGGGAVTINSGDVAAESDGVAAKSAVGALTANITGDVKSNSGVAVGLMTTGVNIKTAAVTVSAGKSVKGGVTGIGITTTAGAASATLGDGVTIAATDYGVGVQSATNDATVTTGTGDVISIANSDNDTLLVGIGAKTARTADSAPAVASVRVALGANTTISGSDPTGAAGTLSRGVSAQNTNGGSGSVSVTAAGGLGIALDKGGVGIEAIAMGSGSVNVTTGAGAITISGGSADGIFASANGGSVKIDTALNITLSKGAVTRAVAAGAGGSGATIVTHGVLSATGTVGEGIFASSVDGAISISADGQIVATSRGINADAIGKGAVSVTLAGAGVTGLAETGVQVLAEGGGALSAVINGNIGSSIDSVSSDGVVAFVGAGATGTLAVSGSGSIFAGDDGFEARNDGPGTSSVANSGAITAADDGVNVLSVGAYSVQVATVTAGGAAVQASGAGSGAITTDKGGLVRGNGVGAGNWVIDAVSGAAGTLTINNNGTLRSTAGGAGDQVIRAAGGAVIINNAGHIDGAVSFTGLAGTNAVTFNNTSATSWHTTGTSTFSAGNDTLSNTSTGLIATSGTTTFDFAGDTGVAPRDVFANAGALAIGETAGASTLNLSNLETFNNSGTIALGSTTGAKSDGETNDRLNAPGLTYNASGGATIFLDANLGAATQTSCVAAVSADCVNMAGGTVTGVTKVNVTNVGAAGGLNTTGLALIDVAGGTASAGAFVLDPASPNYSSDWGGSIDTGVFDYRIVFDTTTKTFALVSAPDNEAFEFVYLGSAASEAWYLTAAPWQSEQSDIRDGTESNGPRRGVWLKASGEWARREAAQTYASIGTSFTFDTSHDQDTWALIAGADLGGSEDGKWLFGLQGGYVSSVVNFSASISEATLKGGVIGAYGTYRDGAFHLDGLFNANLLKLENSQGLPSLATNEADVRSYGAQIEAGWRMGDERRFVEPLVSLSYVSTSVDNLAVPGGVVAIEDVNSFRGGLGLRAGASTTTETYRVQGSFTVRGWAEFDGDASATITNPGATLVINDDAEASWGEVSGSVDVLGLSNGVSGFIRAGYRFGSDRTGANAAIGIRAAW